MTAGESRQTAEAIRGALISPNEGDSNGEPANVVDAIFAHGRMTRSGLRDVASALRLLADALRSPEEREEEQRRRAEVWRRAEEQAAKSWEVRTVRDVYDRMERDEEGLPR